MEERDFVDAILDDPDDELSRLVFADWLEEDGQGLRAEWVRTCCERARMAPGGPGFVGAFEREQEAWRRCRPDWWNVVPLSGVGESSDRGLRLLDVKSRSAFDRLGRARWLAMAVDRGWLGWINVVVGNEAIVRGLAGWRGLARQVPLHLRLKAPCSGSTMDLLGAVPRLIKLDLGVGALSSPGVEILIERQDLRALRIKLGQDHNSRSQPIVQGLIWDLLDRVGRLDLLVSLTLEGPRPSPEDPAFLSRLAGMAGLRSLTLIRWPDLTLGAIEALGPLARLRRLNLSACPDATDEGLARVRDALPEVEVRRVP